jgi:hypothetical protein
MLCCLCHRLVVVFDADMCAKPEFFVRMLEVREGRRRGS